MEINKGKTEYLLFNSPNSFRSSVSHSIARGRCPTNIIIKFIKGKLRFLPENNNKLIFHPFAKWNIIWRVGDKKPFNATESVEKDKGTGNRLILLHQNVTELIFHLMVFFSLWTSGTANAFCSSSSDADGFIWPPENEWILHVYALRSFLGWTTRATSSPLGSSHSSASFLGPFGWMSLVAFWNQRRMFLYAGHLYSDIFGMQNKAKGPKKWTKWILHPYIVNRNKTIEQCKNLLCSRYILLPPRFSSC